MSNPLDTAIRAHDMTNESVADALRALGLRCTDNYVSALRNGRETPGLKLANAICRMFPGEVSLADLGLDIDPVGVAPSMVSSTPSDDTTGDGRA